MAQLIKNIEHEKVESLTSLVDYEAGTINSLTLAQEPGAKVTVFAIDEGEGMSSHAAPGDALVHVLEGTGSFTVNGVEHLVGPGQVLVMPAGSPHSARGVTPFKMILTVVKQQG